ncbi:MAG: hypothetical protein WBZ15_22055, partial [Mycobacterium sp.]|uniref:hypothetical protein n=1 Tax=Mycobacterium sp. TaxID=1785 RepID=UPI003C3857C2
LSFARSVNSGTRPAAPGYAALAITLTQSGRPAAPGYAALAITLTQSGRPAAPGYAALAITLGLPHADCRGTDPQRH